MQTISVTMVAKRVGVAVVMEAKLSEADRRTGPTVASRWQHWCSTSATPVPRCWVQCMREVALREGAPAFLLFVSVVLPATPFWSAALFALACE